MDSFTKPQPLKGESKKKAGLAVSTAFLSVVKGLFEGMTMKKEKKGEPAKNEKQSSDKLATKASKALHNTHSSSLTKSLAGSVLSQAHTKKD